MRSLTTKQSFGDRESSLPCARCACSRSQFVTLKRGQNIKYLPYAFTENGVAMLSSVLKSARAIQINIQIMRAFVRIRNLVADNSELRKAIEPYKTGFGFARE